MSRMKINYNQTMVRVRFNDLLVEKQKRDNRHISLLQISKDTGIPYKTIWSWANDDLTRFDANVIETLCRYFACSVGELLEVAGE
jgi:DNA-binding Xre family transcriptional regulator